MFQPFLSHFLLIFEFFFFSVIYNDVRKTAYYNYKCEIREYYFFVLFLGWDTKIKMHLKGKLKPKTISPHAYSISLPYIMTMIKKFTPNNCTTHTKVCHQLQLFLLFFHLDISSANIFLSSRVLKLTISTWQNREKCLFCKVTQYCLWCKIFHLLLFSVSWCCCTLQILPTPSM